MEKDRIKTGEQFHGHLGPFLVVGIKMSNLALEKLNAKKYFGMHVHADMGTVTPLSYILDEIQISRGCTLGKGNIEVSDKRIPQALFISNGETCKISFKMKWLDTIYKMLKEQNERNVADLIWKTDNNDLFEI